MKIKLVIPKLPISLNRLYKLHWTKRHRILQEWIDEVFWISRKDKLIPDKPFDKARIRIKYYFPDRRRRDKDNYMPKYILDSLRYNRIIRDDSTEHIDLDWKILQGKPARTEIYIEEVR